MGTRRRAPLVDATEFHHDDQHKVMNQIVKDGVCPFCQAQLAKYHRQPILWENDRWLVTENDYPYEGTRFHFLIIRKQHRHIEDVGPSAWVDLGRAVDWIIEHYKIKGGTFLMRFGEMEYNGSSVQHLHAHIIVGRKKGTKTESLKVKVGYRKKRG